MSQIKLQNITKTYQVGEDALVAVQDVSLDIQSGDFISIVGHSGSGKTTLLSMIGGITTPTSGRISFEDTDLSAMGSDGLSEYRCRKIGFMFQFASLLPMLTVKENLLLPTMFVPEPERTYASKLDDKAAELLRSVGLLDKINAFPGQLSGGQQRRVAIARSFMNNPKLILADEPTGDLDEKTEQEMINFFKAMNRTEGITFVMVTHNSELARQTQRRLKMHQGSLQTLPSGE
ncbi:MAG: ABC transporter [Deltaproteobacteria bacterium RIFOXYD12_FULL_56_24]|nr:MAG: ABC transporter [Deltaproteobacteria bacterium RIFOXYD12_FULL_56_24]